MRLISMVTAASLIGGILGFSVLEGFAFWILIRVELNLWRSNATCLKNEVVSRPLQEHIPLFNNLVARV